MQPRVGLKRTVPEGTAEEAAQLHKLYDDLRQQLTTPRIERCGGRALASWDAEEQAVCVLRKDGKFGSFGYSRDGKYFLEYFEALFLLELGRLQLEYHAMLMSVEQAYLLLLGEQASPKYNEYLVYSYLSRMGYILIRHQNVSYENRIAATAEDCAYELAISAIRKCDVPAYIKRSPHYAKVKNSMQKIKESIMRPESAKHVVQPRVEQEEVIIDFSRKVQPAGKRKAESAEMESVVERKRRCMRTAAENKSLLNMLKDEPEYKQFQQTFAKFDIVQLQTNIECDDNCRNLQINFDLYLHNDGFKKSTPKPPTFRVIVLNSGEAFPTHAEIALCHKLQKWPVPLLIVSVGESKQIQAFLYHFS